MIILKESAVAQELKFIPRELSATSFILRDETTNESVTTAATFTISDYYLTTTVVFAIKEFTYYNLTVLNGTDIVYKGKIFCTNQVIKDYTVNQSEYIQRVTTNEFKIYE